MRFSLALATVLGANFAFGAAVMKRNDCDGGYGGGSGGGGSSSSSSSSTTTTTNTGNQCPQTHPVASCCNGGAGGVLGILSASSLGCTLNVLQNNCNQQPYCCQNNGGVSLIDVSCIQLQL